MRGEDGHKYDDIINLPHHISARHPQMTLSERAAQFAPFAALTGHNAAIQETARYTDSFAELDEDGKELLDEKLRELASQLQEEGEQEPEVEITYFRPDLKKCGGSYVTVSGRVKKIDGYKHQILLADGTVIDMEYLFSIVEMEGDTI